MHISSSATGNTFFFKLYRNSEENASEFLDIISKLFLHYWYLSVDDEQINIIMNIYIALFFEITQSAVVHMHIK